MSRFLVRSAGVAASLLLCACVAQSTRPALDDQTQLAHQREREATLAARPDWSASGRLGVSDGRDGGSGSLEWSQRGDSYRFSVHAPVTGKTWTLAGDAHHAVLEGVRDQPAEGGDAAALLERELGWHVPVGGLARWARGMRAGDAARVHFRADGLPASIEEAGWKIDYLDYDDALVPPLPTKVFASKDGYKVRLAIREWTLH